MTTGWTILLMLLLSYCCFSTVVIVFLLWTTGFWHKKADEFEAQLIVTKSALDISNRIDRRL